MTINMKTNYESILIHPILVDKTSISTFTFPEDSIHNSEIETKNLMIKLKVAASLGAMKKKCKIFFEDSIELKVVETTVWSISEENVMLKAGISIPLKRILHVTI